MRAALRFFRDAYASLPASVWWLCAVAFVNRAGTMVVPFLTLWLTLERGFSIGEAGLLMGCFGLGSMFGAWVGGRATDRIGPWPVQVASLLGSGILFVVLGELRTATAIAGALFVLGLVADAFRPANYAMLAANCPPALRGKAFALARLAVNLGWSIGPAIGGVLAQRAYALLFWIDGATSVLAALLLIALRSRLATQAEPDAAAEGAGLGPWRDRAFIVVLASTFAVAMVFMQFFFTAPLHYERHYGLDEAAIGLLSASNSLIIVAVEMALVHALRYRHPLPVVALGALLIAIGFGMTPLGTTFWFGAVAVAVWTLGEMLESPLLMAWVSSRAGAGDRGRYMALLTIVHSLAFLLAPIAGTWAFDRLGPAWLWFGCLGVGCMAAFGFAWAARIDHRCASPPT